MPTLSSNGTQTATVAFLNDDCSIISMPYKDREKYNEYHRQYYKGYKTKRQYYYWKNVDKIREKRKKEWAENKNGIRDRHREYRKKNWKHLLELNNLARKKYREKNRLKIIERARGCLIEAKYTLCDILGSRVCVMCGYSDIRAIHFDHIDGKGHKSRNEMFGRRIMSLYELRRIVKNPVIARKTFQVLCSNCNWIKRWEKFECVRGEIK